jgi:hypothetical protein
MTDHIIRDKDGAALGIDWFALATEITNRPIAVLTAKENEAAS